MKSLSLDAWKQLCFDTLLETQPDMIFFKDSDLKYLAGSESFAQMVHLNSRADIVGKTDYDIFEPSLADKYIQDDRALLRNGNSCVDYVEPLPDSNGKRRYSSTSKYVVHAPDGSVAGLLGVARDVTAQIELAEEKERRDLSRQMFDDVMEGDLTHNTLMRVDRSRCLSELGIIASDTFNEAVHRIARELVHPNHREEYLTLYGRERLIASYEAGNPEFKHVMLLRYAADAYQWVEASTRLYHSKITDTLRITTFLRNLDEEIRTKETLRRKAEHDSLTDVLNRESAVAQITHYIENHAGGTCGALLFADLDAFKQVNDTKGHIAGDDILRCMAKRLMELAGPNGVVGRMGGDEFLVLLANVSGQEEVARRVELFLLEAIDADAPEVTCSVGITLYDGGERPFCCLYAQADAAMYEAKRRGKNCFAFYTDPT